MNRNKLIMRCMAMILMASKNSHITYVRFERPILTTCTDGSDPIEISTAMIWLHEKNPMDCIYVSDHEMIKSCIIWVDEINANPIDLPILEAIHQALFELVAPQFNPIPASV